MLIRSGSPQTEDDAVHFFGSGEQTAEDESFQILSAGGDAADFDAPNPGREGESQAQGGPG